MENQFKKWVNLSYLAVAVLLAYLVFWAGMKLGATFDLETRVRDLDLVVRGVSLGAGVLLFGILFSNQKANDFMGEVVLELSRVSWPTPKDARAATVIVVIMVLISGVVLGFLDYFCTQVMAWVL